MQLASQKSQSFKILFWAGWVMTVLATLFLLFDGVVHIIKIDPVVESFGLLGYPISVALGLGIVELVCVVLYVVRPTSVLGAVLLTGYLGGGL